MPSPFPGMDPYLEGVIWPDVHQRLATEISRRLAPRLRPGYVARLALTVFHDDPSIEGIGIVYPDVEITRRSMGALLHELQARVVEPVATDSSWVQPSRRSTTKPSTSYPSTTAKNHRCQR